MGFGLGIFLVVLGLVLALAVDASISGIDIQLIGWILVLAGVLVMALTAVQLQSRRRSSTVARTMHSDGTETVTERSTNNGPPVY